MNDLISRAALLKALNSDDSLKNARKLITLYVQDAPAVEAAPVVHGTWSKKYASGHAVHEGFVSSCCDMWNERKCDYCPSCGARMDGESNGWT